MTHLNIFQIFETLDGVLPTSDRKLVFQHSLGLFTNLLVGVVQQVAQVERDRFVCGDSLVQRLYAVRHELASYPFFVRVFVPALFELARDEILNLSFAFGGQGKL